MGTGLTRPDCHFTVSECSPSKRCAGRRYLRDSECNTATGNRTGGGAGHDSERTDEGRWEEGKIEGAGGGINQPYTLELYPG